MLKGTVQVPSGFSLGTRPSNKIPSGATGASRGGFRPSAQNTVNTLVSQIFLGQIGKPGVVKKKMMWSRIAATFSSSFSLITYQIDCDRHEKSSSNRWATGLRARCAWVRTDVQYTTTGDRCELIRMDKQSPLDFTSVGTPQFPCLNV